MPKKESKIIEVNEDEILDVFDNPNAINNNNNIQEESVMNNNNQNNQNNNQKAPMSPVVKNIIGGAACIAVGAAACYFVTQKLNNPTCNVNTNQAFKADAGALI